MRAISSVARNVLPFIRRKTRQYPKSTVILALLSPFLCLYLVLYILICYATFGRWYWNYAIYYAPALMYILPNGGWGPTGNGPRFVQEIYDAPRMGEWTVAELTRPVYHRQHTHETLAEADKGDSSVYAQVADIGVHDTAVGVEHADDMAVKGTTGRQSAGAHVVGNEIHDGGIGIEHMDDLGSKEDASKPPMHESTEFDLQEIVKRAVGQSHADLPNPSSLSSPSLIKLHIFSSVSESSRLKRHLIRQLSPLYNIPAPYRHLVEMKFVLGHSYKIEEDWAVNEEMEALMAAEQEEYGDMLRLNLAYGENLRWGKILDWINTVGMGRDGGRDSWWLFKVDDDTVLNLPTFLDTLMTLDPKDPYYLGTSLNRWPAFIHHFTGMVTGFSWPVVKTLAAGIEKMSRQEIEQWWDDDVLTGELTFCLPPAPHCRSSANATHWQPTQPLPAYCNPIAPYPGGWLGYPPNPDPRTGLDRYDFLRRTGDPECWLTKGDIALHGWTYKSLAGYEKGWRITIEGKMWDPPDWMEPYAEIL